MLSSINIITLLLTALTAATLYQHTSTSTSKLCLLVLLCNPILLQDVLYRPEEVMMLECLVLWLSSQHGWVRTGLRLLLLCTPWFAVTLVDVSFDGFHVLGMMCEGIRQYYHVEVYGKGTNMMWLLYSHMFAEYDCLYRVMLCLLPWMTLYPIRKLNLPPAIQQAIIYFFCAFITHAQGYTYMLVLAFMYIRMYPHLQHAQLEQGFKVWPLLTIVLTVVSVGFGTFYGLLLEVWSHGWMANMGYLLVYQIVFWIANAIYLGEAVQLCTAKPNNFSLKQYLTSKIKQI